MSIDDVKSICETLPGVTQDIKWGADLCFSIAKKMFCVTGLGQHPPSVSFKVTDDEFDQVSARIGFRPADYVARYKWVTVDDMNALPKKELEEFIRQSYELVKAKLPKKDRERLSL